MDLWAVTGKMKWSCWRNVPPRGALDMSVSILNKFGDLSLLSSELVVLPLFRMNLLFTPFQDLYQSPSAGFMGLHKSCFCLSENQRKAQVQVASGVGFKEWPKPEVKHGDNVSLFLFPKPPKFTVKHCPDCFRGWKVLGIGKSADVCSEGADKDHGKDLSKVRGSIQVLELCLQSAQSCLWIKTLGFCNASYCVQPHKGLRIKQMLLLYNLLKKILKSQSVLKARRMCSAQRHHQQSLTEGSITLQVKIVFLLCLPSKNLTAIWFSSVLMIDFSWMLGWELF